MEIIHSSQIIKERWTDTSYLRTDGKEEFREKARFGNRHAVFEKGSTIGHIHYDKYNATNIPVGTINHVAKYTEEKTGIPQGIVVLAIVAVAIVGFFAVGRYLIKKL